MAGLVRRLRIPLLATCLAALAGCGLLPNTSDPGDISARTEITHDRYDGLWKARGPEIYDFGNRDIKSYRLRAASASPDFAQVARAQLYVIARLDHRLYLGDAHSAGVAFDVTRIEREVERCDEDRCRYLETIGINMSVTQLRAIAASPGFDVRISGRKGNVYLFVPASYFQGFLLAIGQPPG